MSILSKIQALITAANNTTGESDTTLTDAVQTLVDGYGQGGGTLRTTHYHGTLSYSNQVSYNPTIPVTDILSTDMVLVVLKLKRTGTVADGVTTWNDELVVPSEFGSSSTKLWIVSRSAVGFGVIRVKSTDATTVQAYSVIYSTVRGIYGVNYGNEVSLTTTIGENGITLTQQGWNIRVCTSGVATEYEYDVYVMTEDGNVIVSGG